MKSTFVPVRIQCDSMFQVEVSIYGMSVCQFLLVTMWLTKVMDKYLCVEFAEPVIVSYF